MVEDRITDGKRIGQLLASELTGLERGPLAAVSVVNADRDVEPTPAGARAYAVEYQGARIGAVSVTPSTALLSLEGDWDLASDRSDLTVTRGDGGTGIEMASGAAVKGAVDLLVDALED